MENIHNLKNIPKHQEEQEPNRKVGKRQNFSSIWDYFQTENF